MTTTQQVQTVLNGTNIPINVTVAKLSSDLNLKDFVVIVGGAVVPNINYSKSSATTIVYTGTPLTNQSTIIRRRTPAEQMHTVDYTKRISSNDWADELDRLYRRVVEVELFGYNYLGGFIGSGNSVVNDQAFNVDWGLDSSGVASRKAVYNKLVAMDNTTTLLSVAVGNLQTGLASFTSSFTANQTTLQTAQTAQGSRITALENLRLNDTVLFARRTTTQTLTNGSYTRMLFNTEVLDPYNSYDPLSGTFLAPESGLYEFVVFASVVGGSITQPSMAYIYNATTNTQLEPLGFFTVVGLEATATWVAQVSLTAGVSYAVSVRLSAQTAPDLVGGRLLIRRID